MKHAIASVVVLAATAASLSAQTPGPQPGAFPAAGAPAIVTMISTGAAPRTALRYAPPAASKQRSDTTMVMSMGMEIGGQSVPAMALPTVTMGSECAVTAVAPSGDITYSMIFTKAEADASANPAVAEQFRAMSGMITSIKGTATISNRGIVRTSSIDMGTMANSQVAQLMGSATDMLKQSAIPLPEEELGVGARWEVRSTTDAGGLTLSQKTVYEIIAFDGKAVTLKGTIEQTALPQAITNPALPPGADVQLAQYTGSGASTMRFSLDELVPTGETASESTMVMNINMGGMAQQMVTTTSIKMTVAPGK